MISATRESGADSGTESSPRRIVSPTVNVRKGGSACE
jgi:hypothetical protein